MASFGPLFPVVAAEYVPVGDFYFQDQGLRGTKWGPYNRNFPNTYFVLYEGERAINPDGWVDTPFNPQPDLRLQG